MKRINDALETAGGKITSVVGTMWCAIAFAIIALVSLARRDRHGNLVTIISWIAQTFLQLVLLSVIMVGQDLQARGTAQIITETHEATLAELKLAQLDRRRNAEELADLKKIAQALHVELRKVPKVDDARALRDGDEADQPVAGRVDPGRVGLARGTALAADVSVLTETTLSMPAAHAPLASPSPFWVTFRQSPTATL
jgi:hypothetical protein